MPLSHAILRRTFYLAAALSALFLLASLILWPVSHHRRLVVYYLTAGGDEYALAAEGGRVGVLYVSVITGVPGWHCGADLPQWIHWSYLSWNTPDPDALPLYAAPTFLGACWFHLPPGAARSEHGALVPLSHIAALLSLGPLLALRAIHRRRALPIGHCPKCHYDLRAHPPGTRCPECGTPVKSRK